MPNLTAFADERLVFSLAENAAIRADGNVAVSVKTEENPGVQSWVLVLCYDSGAVGFSGIEDGAFGKLTVSDDKSGRVTVNCFGSGDVSAEGIAFTALFVPKADSDSCEFTLVPSEDAGDFFNYSGEDVTCSVSRGRLTVALDKSGFSDKVALPPEEQPSEPVEEITRESAETQEKTVSADSDETNNAAEESSEAPAENSPVEDIVSAPTESDNESAAALNQTEKQNAAASESPSESAASERPSKTGGASPMTAFALALIAAGTVVVSRRR